MPRGSRYARIRPACTVANSSKSRVSGADIVREMYQSGELQKLLEGVKQQA
jgi:glutaredoxin-related protein